ncbi:aldehyde oxidase [Thalassotalea insulae]|uniref:Aldehyde oxidase n=1 Tax=Thalassotalea insulae TaxID=2056778 RepID=A0ABQ6GM56_9GAMM|nr:molybdopterin cofactor-binding domain-containing protein [Thalassotalea insulae]GLX77068.1 aldehyde oxidase [Thalassotalea insulae]
MNKRSFLKLSALASGGLLFGFSLQSNSQQLLSPNTLSKWHELDALIHISADNNVTIILNRVEMGQGILTGLPMLIAEELEADWQSIRVEQAKADEDKYGIQTTTASISIHSGWTFARMAGARVKQLLIAAAAQRWQVKQSECKASQSFIYGPHGLKISFGRLAKIAAQLPAPKNAKLKSPENFTLIGKSVPQLQLSDKVTGQAQYGIDVNVNGAKIATIIKPPVRDAKLIDWRAPANTSKVEIIATVAGLAVIGNNFWHVQQAARQLEVNWSVNGYSKISSHALMDKYRNQLANTTTVNKNGNFSQAVAEAEHIVEAQFETPYMAHATMEPLNATAIVSDKHCEIFAPTQAPDKVQQDVSELLGLPKEKVTVNVTLLGGGFGRKSYRDFIIDAVLIAKKAAQPVKLIYNRENDIRYDMLRPATVYQAKAALTANGELTGLSQQAAGPSILQFYQYPKVNNTVEAVDYLTFAGIDSSPYNIANISNHAYTDNEPKGPAVGILRSIGHSTSCFVRECFIDQLAAYSNTDPLNYRLALLTNNHRAKAVLEKAAQLANWGKPLAKGHFLGCALFEENYPEENYYACNAQIVELSIINNRPKLHRVISVGDFGRIIHPDLVFNQMEGGVVFGMSLTLYDKITISNGQVEQSNFHDYRLPRMPDIPQIDCFIMPSAEIPSGVGEKVVPATIPAICNAYYAATGQPITKLPINS